MWKRGKLAFSLSLVQFAIVSAFTLKAYYGKDADASDASHSYTPAPNVLGAKFNSINSHYHAMDEFLKFLVLVLGTSISSSCDYLLSGVGHALLTVAIGLQISLVSRSLLHGEKIIIDVTSLMKACNAALSVSLASRSVQATLSSMQLVFFVSVATLCFQVNLFITEKFMVHDLFPGIRVLMFGSFFGVAASFAGDRELHHHRNNLKACSNNQLVILLSAAMGYCMWPTVLAGSSTGDKRHRIIMNAILSQTSAVVTSYAASSLLNPQNLFDAKLVQIGTTAGSVIISSIVSFMVYPAGAVLIGAAGAAVAIVSFLLLTPCLTRKLHVPDYFDVVSSYCMPSLVSAILSVMYSWLASEADYGLTMYEIFPARSPKYNTSELEEIIDLSPRIQAGEGRTAADQTMFQVLTILITVFFACSSGVIAGFCTRSKFLDPLQTKKILHDGNDWHIPHVIVTGNENNGEVSGGDASEAIEIPERMKMRTRSVI